MADGRMTQKQITEERIKYIVEMNSKLYEAYYEAGFTGRDSVRLTVLHGLKLGRDE